ncbi:MAG: hypothetical protein EPN97_16570 [Alphaproteobacteria bacterium]|nr:MAG: hypothetical protein EPN97_16570 [Alphaproteobacteria bacterium]
MARFFHCGLTQQELMKRAFRIKPVASNLAHDLAIPDDLREKFTELYFTQPTDLELGTLDERSITKDRADMLKPVRTIPLALKASGGGHFYPYISELLSAVPEDLLYTVTAFSVVPDKKQPLDANGRQRALVTFYEGELPQKIKDQYIIYDGQAYSPDWRLMEKLDRIPVMRPLKIKGSGR